MTTPDGGNPGFGGRGDEPTQRMPAQQPGPAGPGGPGYYDDRGYDDRGYDDRGPADDGRRKGVGWLALAIAGLVLLLLGLLGGCLVGQSMCDDCGEQVTTTVTTRSALNTFRMRARSSGVRM